MEALVKCGVVMVSIALGYQHIEQGNRTMNEPDYTRLTLLPPAQSGHHSPTDPCPLLGVKRTLPGPQAMSANDPKRTFDTDQVPAPLVMIYCKATG